VSFFPPLFHKPDNKSPRGGRFSLFPFFFPLFLFVGQTLLFLFRAGRTKGSFFFPPFSWRGMAGLFGTETGGEMLNLHFFPPRRAIGGGPLFFSFFFFPASPPPRCRKQGRITLLFFLAYPNQPFFFFFSPPTPICSGAGRSRDGIWTLSPPPPLLFPFMAKQSGPLSLFPPPARPGHQNGSACPSSSFSFFFDMVFLHLALFLSPPFFFFFSLFPSSETFRDSLLRRGV